MPLPFQEETGATVRHATGAAGTQADRAPAQRSQAWYAKRDVSVAYARHPRRHVTEPASKPQPTNQRLAPDTLLDVPTAWRQRIDELETTLRHKDLKLQAVRSENQIMRQNIRKLMKDLEVMEKIVATLGHRRRA